MTLLAHVLCCYPCKFSLYHGNRFRVDHVWGLPACINLSTFRNSTGKENAVHKPQQPLRFPQQHAAKSFSRLRPLATGLAHSRCRQLANRRTDCPVSSRINRGRLTDRQHSLAHSSRRGVTQQAADSAGGTAPLCAQLAHFAASPHTFPLLSLVSKLLFGLTLYLPQLLFLDQLFL